MSGKLGSGNLKKSNKVTSFHFYPETGLLQFSNTNFGSCYVNTNAGEGSSTQQAQATGKAELVWDEDGQAYKYWDGTQWVWEGS